MVGKTLIDKDLKDLLSKEYLSNRKTTVGFPDFTDKQYLTDDNRKYMKMYRWLSPFYDITEKMVERFWSHHRIAEMRRQLMDKLEWRNALSVLCVSVGTGRDFDFIPKQIDIRSLQICGIDINVEMMKRCRRKWNGKLDLTLVRCCAEELPFKDECFDIVFHFGGVNFFNDKQKALEEMVRVAKKGSKLLVADETDDLIRGGYNKIGFSRRYFKDAQVNVKAIKKAVPEHVTEKETDYLWDGRIYCVTFRK